MRWIVSLVLACAACGPAKPAGEGDSGSVDSGEDGGEGPRVRTLAEHAGSDDATWHPDGFLLVSDLVGDGAWPRNPSGTQILAVDPADGALTAWGEGLPRPIGSALAPDGTLYVASYGRVSSVWSVPPGGGEAVEVATGLAYPSGVLVLDDGSVLVTEWGADRVSRLVGGGAEVYAELPKPVGIDRRADGTVVVASVAQTDDDGLFLLAGAGVAPERWVTIPDFPADFTAAPGGLYVTTLEGHRVWVVRDDGTVDAFAGTGEAGEDDGPVAEATFTSPNGIAASPDGAHLYVQQLDGRLRVIDL